MGAWADTETGVALGHRRLPIVDLSPEGHQPMHSVCDEALLDEKMLLDQGFFNPGSIRDKWNEHLKETSDWQYHLWDVLMFQAWLEHERQMAQA
jgi:asparagine synthase